MNQIQLVTPPQTIGIILKDGSTHFIDEECLQMMRMAHPGKDIEHELRQMAGWCYSNPAKRKTRRGINRFLNAWLSRSTPPSAIQGGQSTRSRTLQEDYLDRSWAV